jgi:hypothetical protein
MSTRAAKAVHVLKRNRAGTRPPEARDKLAEAFLADLYADWCEQGKAAIAALRAEKPGEYVRIAASLLPKEPNLEVDPIDELTDAELAELIAQLAALAGLEIRAVAPAGGAGAAGDESEAAR